MCLCDDRLTRLTSHEILGGESGHQLVVQDEAGKGDGCDEGAADGADGKAISVLLALFYSTVFVTSSLSPRPLPSLPLPCADRSGTLGSPAGSGPVKNTNDADYFSSAGRGLDIPVEFSLGDHIRHTLPQGVHLGDRRQGPLTDGRF